MALVDCDFFSESLEVGTSVTVVLPQATEAQIGVDATARHERGDAGPLPAPRPLGRPHRLAALHVDRALRDGRGSRGRDAGRAPQLLHRRAARPRLLDLRRRGAAPGHGLVLPVLRPARGHLRRRPLHGRVRRAEARARRTPTGSRPRRPCPGPSTSPDWPGARSAATCSTRVFDGEPGTRRGPVRAARRRRRSPRSRRCTSPAGPRTRCSRSACDSPTRPARRARRSPPTSAPASTSGGSGTRHPRRHRLAAAVTRPSIRSPT